MLAIFVIGFVLFLVVLMLFDRSVNARWGYDEEFPVKRRETPLRSHPFDELRQAKADAAARRPTPWDIEYERMKARRR